MEVKEREKTVEQEENPHDNIVIVRVNRVFFPENHDMIGKYFQVYFRLIVISMTVLEVYVIDPPNNRGIKPEDCTVISGNPKFLPEHYI